MTKILCGLETEYGLYVEGRGAENQIEDATTLVRSYPGERRVLWDYRFESSRQDMRGYSVGQLSIDPEDAKFDAGRTYGSDAEVRSDRILANGARLYNDHGHPEYATPECWSLDELVKQDLAGQAAVLRAAKAMPGAKLYKNNTDFHGATYGTHESYLVPRSLPFENLVEAVLPVLLARQLLCGAGKVGSESGAKCDFQLSQRADFMTEVLSVDTLYRRPIFNTRDEPHADASWWRRLHVISGDANMNPVSTKIKVGLIKIAVALALAGQFPKWNFADPIRAIKEVSRDPEAPIALSGRSWTTAEHILRSYLEGTSILEDPELAEIAAMGNHLLDQRQNDFSGFAGSVDWAAKRMMLEQFGPDLGSMQAYDLEYHNVDPDEGLYFAVNPRGETPDGSVLDQPPTEGTRARARALALEFDALTSASWGHLTFGSETIAIDPTADYSALQSGMKLPDFKAALKGLSL
ncbi:MAG: proteasome accessory factor PafA2 family protein [Fimbriimonadaceae bacterium]